MPLVDVWVWTRTVALPSMDEAEAWIRAPDINPR